MMQIAPRAETLLAVAVAQLTEPVLFDSLFAYQIRLKPIAKLLRKWCLLVTFENCLKKDNFWMTSLSRSWTRGASNATYRLPGRVVSLHNADGSSFFK